MSHMQLARPLWNSRLNVLFSPGIGYRWRPRVEKHPTADGEEKNKWKPGNEARR